MTILEVASISLGVLGVVNIIRIILKHKEKDLTHLQNEIDYCRKILDDYNGVEIEMLDPVFAKASAIASHVDGNVDIKEQCLAIMKECNRYQRDDIHRKIIEFEKKWGTKPDLGRIQTGTLDQEDYNRLTNSRGEMLEYNGSGLIVNQSYDINRSWRQPDESITTRYGLSCARCGHQPSGCFCLVTQAREILNNMNQPEDVTDIINDEIIKKIKGEPNDLL